MLKSSSEQGVTMSEGAELFRRAFDQSPIPIVLVSLRESRLLEANPAAVDVFGFEGRENIGRPLAELALWADPADQSRYRKLLEQSGSVTGFELTMRDRQGRNLALILSGSIVRIGGEPCSLNFLVDQTARREAARALAESEEKFRRVFDESPIIVVLLSVPDGEIIEINASGLASFGYAREEMVGRTTVELNTWADPADRAEYLRRLTTTGAVRNFETRMRRKNGEILTVLNNGSLIKIGEKTYSLNSLQDISERKRSDEAREASVALARATLESTADGILAVNASGKIESYNRILAQMWQIPDEVLEAGEDERAIQTILNQLVAPDAFLDKVRHLYAHPSEESFDTIDFLDGRVFERYSRPMAVNGRPTGRVWSFRDISQRRTAEATVHASEEKFRGVFDKSPVIMGLLTVPEGQFVEVNEAGVAAFGYTREEALGHTSLELNIWADPAARDRYLQLLKERGAVAAYEARMRRKNGEIFTVLYTGSFIRIAGKAYSLNILQDITAHKRTEESFRASEQRYERVVQNISDALMIDDVAGRIVFANDRFRRLFGLDSDEKLEDIILEDLVAPEDRATLRDYHDRRVRGEPAPAHYDYEAIRRDGSRFWLEVDVTPVTENGVITGTQSLNRDITERKITEQAMRLLSTGTATLRGQTFYEQIALETARLLGADMGLVARSGMPATPGVRTLGLCLDGRLLPPMEYALVDTPCANILDKNCLVYSSGVARLFPKVAMFGELRMEGYAAAPLRTLDGKVLGHVAIVCRRPIRLGLPLLESVLQMIAFKVAVEIEREAAESKFHDLFAFAPDAILIATGQGVITDANQRAVEMFGYDRTALTRLTAADLIPAELRPELLRRLGAYLASPVPHAMGTSAPGLYAIAKDGRRFPIDISLSPLHSDQGLLVVAAIRDITGQIRAAEQRQQIESQLRQAQKMESLGTLAGGIAHDFNNILTGMLGFVELIRQDIPENHPAQKWIGNLSLSGDRAKNLVRQILTFSRKNEGERAPLRLQHVAEEAVRLLRATIPVMIEIETDFVPGCPPVIADSNQMHQVLINLCTNAWHAMPATGGRIRVELAPCTVPAGSDLLPPANQPGPYVRLTVADNGSGMDPHTQERIYDPFFTTKKTGEGTGLGLAVVHGIVQSHDGFIRLRSAPGQGTCFELYFPAINAPMPLASTGAAGPRPQGLGEHFLLLDDDLAGGMALTKLLERLGYRVTAFHNPLTALAAFQAAPGAFALVITDLAMPGLTGTQFARQVRQLNPRVPLLLISGFVGPEQQRELLALGVSDFLRKPPTVDELARAVSTCLGRRPAG